MPPGTYILTEDALPDITTDVTIEGTGGAGVTTITGADTTDNTTPAGGVIAVAPASGAKLTIRGLTISGNRVAGTASTSGGAIANDVTGRQLTCSPGTFTGATSFALTWLRSGTPIAGATASTYTLTAVDAGQAIQCRVTATGPGGTIVAESAPNVSAKACIVPTVVGKTGAAAKKALKAANCALGKATKRKSTKKVGTVIASSPPKGRNLAAGTRVALTLARK